MSYVQKQVQQAIDQLVDSGAERGIQVAAYKRGELVVDAVAGVADPATERLVESDTTFYNFSIVKGAAATLAHMLVERSMFGYDTPVVDLWPEFGAHDKQKVTVRHVLNHSAGVPAIPLDTTAEDLCDWDKMCAAIAGSELWWEPGTKVGYHAYTFGYLVGEIIRRATGKPISQVLLEQVSGPLGVGDELYFGMPKSEQGRLARLEDAPSDPAAMAAMASMPPRPLIIVTVASSSVAMQSHNMLPSSVRTSSARWPIANAGVEPIPMMPLSYSRNVLVWDCCRA